MFISFEGIDGSGKTTQARLLYEELRKRGRCVLTAEPTESSIGALIRDLIKKERINGTAVQLLFTADRAVHVDSLIKPKLEQGYTVITDRYVLSTIAYGMASGLDGEWLRAMNDVFIKPDITFVFDVDPKEAVKRISARKGSSVYFEKLKFLTATRSAYLKLAKEYNCRVIDGNN